MRLWTWAKMKAKGVSARKDTGKLCRMYVTVIFGRPLSVMAMVVKKVLWMPKSCIICALVPLIHDGTNAD